MCIPTCALQSNVLRGLEIVSIVFVYDAPQILRHARPSINTTLYTAVAAGLCQQAAAEPAAAS